MSNLISRQKAIEAIGEVDNYGDGIAFEVLSHAMRDISLLPTVEAIPVEWIEQFGKENFYDWDTEFNAISVMLDAWRKEGKHETRIKGI